MRSGPLHELYSPAITAALRKALRRFDRSLPGFISEAGLLHGVETRTSAPVGDDDGLMGCCWWCWPERAPRAVALHLSCCRCFMAQSRRGVNDS